MDLRKLNSLTKIISFVNIYITFYRIIVKEYIMKE